MWGGAWFGGEPHPAVCVVWLVRTSTQLLSRRFRFMYINLSGYRLYRYVIDK
jgi:hypothetical protein